VPGRGPGDPTLRSPRRRPETGGGRDRTRGPSVGIGGTQVEGRQAVRELLRAGTRPVRQVHMAEGGRPSEALAEIVDLAAQARVTVRWVSREQLDAMAATEAPQGVVATAAPVREWALDELVSRPAPFLVVLDGVTDPHNLGAVMRSALCAGATGLVVGLHRSAPLSPAAVKAAAGAVEHLAVAPVVGVPAALSLLRDAGVWTVGLDAGGPSPVWDLPVATEAVALVLGAEGRGLSPLARARCDVVASIPLLGPLGALNVSAAAAVACFEVARRRARPSGN
jgi:23S rRNA (guanosine2251-2'-O)-methyltransferase